MAVHFPVPVAPTSSSVMDAVQDLMLAGEMFAEARVEIDWQREAWEARVARQQDTYWTRRDAEAAR